MDSPLARIQVADAQSTKPRLQIPEYINLPSGQQFNVGDLLRRRSRSQTINLRTYHETKKIKAKSDRPRKPRHTYTFEERAWIATAQPADIAQRFDIKLATVKLLKQQCQDLMIYMSTAAENNERNS